MHTPLNRFRCLKLAATFVGSVLLLAGCQTHPGQVAEEIAAAEPVSLRTLPIPEGADQSHRDRWQLARLIGAWDVEGWSTLRTDTRTTFSGIAAGTIDHDWFLLVEFELLSQTAGTTEPNAGNMLFAHESGQGLTLTAWFDSDPSLSRFYGGVSSDGSVLVFDEMNTATGDHRARITIRFRSDDKWTMELADLSKQDMPIEGMFTFTRSP